MKRLGHSTKSVENNKTFNCNLNSSLDKGEEKNKNESRKKTKQSKMIATEKKSVLNKKNLILFGVLGVTICLIVGLTVGIVLTTAKDDFQRAVSFLSSNPLVDGHNDIASMIRKNFQNRFEKFNFNDLVPLKESLLGTDGVTHTDIKRLKEGKLGAQFWAAYASCESLAKDAPRIHLEQLDVIKRLINKFPDHMEYVTTSEGSFRHFV